MERGKIDMTENAGTLVTLHVLLAVYSLSSVCSKLAAGTQFLGVRFCLLYGGVILLLGIYALAWQQIIKRVPLTTAFANKAVTVAWGLVWGLLVFHEAVTPGKLAGVALVMAGVFLFSKADEEVEQP